MKNKAKKYRELNAQEPIQYTYTYSCGTKYTKFSIEIKAKTQMIGRYQKGKKKKKGNDLKSSVCFYVKRENVLY